MVAALPVPIDFALPEGWRFGPPDQLDAAGAAAVLLSPNRENGFTANITVDGELVPRETSLAAVADHSVDKLAAATEQASLVQREELGSAAAPGLTQLIRLTTMAGGVRRELLQGQVYIRADTSDELGRRAVIRFAFTGSPVQYEELFPEFQSFVSSVSVGGPNGVGDQ